MGIFLLCLVLTIAFPMINISFNHLHYSIEKTKMIYLAESVAETLKNEEISNDVFEQIKIFGQVNFECLDDDDLDKYQCRIIQLEEDEYLWNLKIILSQRNSEVNIKDVEIQAFFPR